MAGVAHSTAPVAVSSAAVTKEAHTEGLTQRKFILSQSWRLEAPDPSASRFVFGGLSPWPVDMALFSSVRLHVDSLARVHVLITSYKDTGHIGAGATRMTSRYLSYLSKGSVSKSSHILRSWGLGLEHINLGWGTQFSP